MSSFTQMRLAQSNRGNVRTDPSHVPTVFWRAKVAKMLPSVQPCAGCSSNWMAPPVPRPFG